MTLEANGRNVMLDALGAAADFASLHTAAPSTTGANEASGGSPAYARKAITWAAASAGSMSANGTLPVFDVPAGTYTHLGLWSASTAGVWYGWADITDEVFAAQGTYTVSAATITAT